MHESKQVRAEWVWSYMQLGARKLGIMIYAHNQSIGHQTVILSFCPYACTCLASIHIYTRMYALHQLFRQYRVATHSAMAIASNADAHTIELAHYYRK